MVRGVIGSGAMGIVYRALDRRLGSDVALKKLRYLTGRDLYRFKREFRSLADIVHPNLVTLYGLHTSGDEWFVTMELIEGIPFVEWVRHWPSDDTVLTAELVADRSTASARTRRRIAEAPLDFARLDAALPQLVDGVLALHACGKLHRDLKPSNVLVTAEGRVVLLDFGLVSDIGEASADRTHRDIAIGTPAYMSPEQAADFRLTEASDWYSVGAMLYEALTGRRPFEGPSAEVLHRKQSEVPPPPIELAPYVPPELDALCVQLIALDPAARPDGVTILGALGSSPSPATRLLERARTARPFVGRTAELETFRRALADSHDHAVTVLVSGESGIGKSQLVSHFLDEIHLDALVIEGICYERESVPFKAIDGAIDALAGALLALPDDDVRAALPSDVAALARLFPVLQRVSSIAERVAVSVVPASPHALRSRASAALRGLVRCLARSRPVVIAIDDLQWGDADSARFLVDMIHDPAPLPVLLILVQRLEGESSLIEALRTPPIGWPGGDVRAISLGPLTDGEACELARVLGAEPAAGLVEEAGGHPLFLSELARAVGRGPPPILEALIADRTATLPPPAWALLRAIAVAGRPLSLMDAARAAGLRGVGVELSLLLAEQLVRLRHVGTDDATHVEPYHERIRAAVVASLSETTLRNVHEALTRTFEHDGEPTNVDALATLWLAAGDPVRAGRYAAQAAEQAAHALAFHRAAELYALAIVHGDVPAGTRRLLHRRRGEALANAGRLDEAADELAEASRGAPPDEALELDALRLEQLLRRGRIAEGMALGDKLLARIGVVLPPSRAEAAAQLRDTRIRRERLGYAFTVRPATELAPEELRRVDLLVSVAMGLAVGDPLIGALVQAYSLDAALELGEPRRACMALASEAGYLGQLGVEARPRVQRLVAEVEELAADIGEPYVSGVATGMIGLGSFALGEWREARARLDRGIHAMSDYGGGVRWELDVAELYHLAALVYLGETEELARWVPLRLRDAIERGDVYAEHGLRAWRTNLAWLIMGQPDAARAHLLSGTTARSPDEPFHLRHYYELASHVLIDLYVGDHEGAWQRLEEAWPVLVASDLLAIQSVRIESGFLRARVALARAATAPPDQRALLELARAVADGLAEEGARWASALAMQVDAMLAAAMGDRTDAAVRFEAAADALADCDMSLLASVAWLRSGELAGDAARTAAGRRELVEKAIADPDAIAWMICPVRA